MFFSDYIDFKFSSSNCLGLAKNMKRSGMHLEMERWIFSSGILSKLMILVPNYETLFWSLMNGASTPIETKIYGKYLGHKFIIELWVFSQDKDQEYPKSFKNFVIL